MVPSSSAEWLETDGLGGFASGTVDGIRTRRYHALLLVATTPPTGRMVLVSGCDVTAQVAGVQYPISSQRYAPDVVHPDGFERLENFCHRPWPKWRYRLENGISSFSSPPAHLSPPCAGALRVSQTFRCC